jgi:DNA-binding NtrC family response regulator
VRELENAVERAVVLGSTDLLLPEDLPEAVLEADLPAGVPVTRYEETIKETKRQLVLKAVEQASGSYNEAAKLLGMHPNNLHRLMRNLNIKTTIKK